MQATPEGSTIVIFRKWKSKKRGADTIIAFFPEELYDSHSLNNCVCYEHVGQHGACSIGFILRNTKPAPEGPDVEALRQELKSIGYTLIERKRVTAHMHAIRMGLIRNKNEMEQLAELGQELR